MSSPRRYSAILVAILVVAANLSVQAHGKVAADSASDKPASGCKIPLQTLKTNLGGYCRGPSKSRVIVFVNGIFGDAVDTWTNGALYWPNLIAQDPEFNDSDIYIHSFESPKIAKAQEIDELAGRMRDFLDVDRVIHDHHEIVFICHSMGGLITRAYLLKARPNPKSVPMIYFFATPTTGANIAGVAAHLSENPQLKYMLPIDENGYVGDLQNAWLSTSDDPKLNYPAEIASYCAYELKDTWGFRVVERQSATNLCNHETRAIVRDHLGIVKPSSTTDDPYVFFKAAYVHTFNSGIAGWAREVIHSEGERRTLVHATSRRAGINTDSGDLSVFGFKSQNSLQPLACGVDRIGTAAVSYIIPSDVEILEVIPTVENGVHLGSTSVALISYNQETAQVRYHLHGPSSQCDVPGRADIVVNLITAGGRR